MDAATACFITAFYHFPSPFHKPFPNVLSFPDITAQKQLHHNFKKSSVSYTLYLHIYFLLNPLHTSIGKDIAPVCYSSMGMSFRFSSRPLVSRN